MYLKTTGYIEKASKLEEGEVEFIVSTGALDSQGERINVDGIDLRDFKKNPVVLWAHDGFNLPIAKATKIIKKDGKLIARAKFYLKDDFPRKVYNYIVDGYLKAVSIGGQIIDFAADGITIDQLLMKEFSVVSIGANSEALVVNKSFTKDQEKELNGLANLYARKAITMPEDKLKNGVKALKELVTALEEVTAGETEKVLVDEVTRRVVLKQAQAVDAQVETIIRSVKLKGESQNE